MAVELFYVLADADCAAARKEVLALGLGDQVTFRNVFYPEAHAALAGYRAQVGSDASAATLPALWDGHALHQGLAAVRAVLERMAAGG
jgi:hypothetical protein